MPNTSKLSEARRALLEKYLRGELRQTVTVNTISRREAGGPAPLSFGQQQLWLLDQLMTGIPVYTECITVHLPGPLNVAVLEQSFNEIIRRHEAWRTTFPMIDGQPFQMIHPYSPTRLPLVDLSDLPETEREREALRQAEEDSQRPFDLANGPLLRSILIRLNDVDHRLFLTLHHIIFDGHSLYQIFLPELHTLYESFLAGKSSPLPELPFQYADFAVWQRKWIQEIALADHLAYWKKQLNGAPETLNLPTDRPHPPVPTYRGLMEPFVIPRSLSDSLKALARQEGTTLYIVLVAAFLTLLYRYTGQDDLPIATAISDRKRPEVQGLMGYFLNTLMLRTRLSGNPTFLDLLKRVREVLLEAFAHQDAPFEYLVKELQPKRNLSRNPLFQVMIGIEPPLYVHPSGWSLTQMDVETGTSKFDISLLLDDRPDGFVGRIEYSTDLFDQASIARMVGHWQTLLAGIVGNPAQRLAELPLLTEKERHQILVEWNATQTAYPEEMCVHQLFEAQVERTPRAVALVFEDQHMSYQELNRRANQLAYYLQQLHVGPEVLVGICMERSLEMVVGLLGILKAGSAYVPLDSTYPAERLAFMLQDTQAPVLLTQRRLLPSLPIQSRAQVICLDADWETIAREPTDNLACSTTAKQLAYVMYTSGSTGKPKGVMIPHRGLVNYLSWCTQAYAVAEGQGTVVHSPIGFDLTITSLFSPLLVGQKAILLPEDQGIEALHTALRLGRDFSLLKITPAHLKLLNQQLSPQKVAGRARALIIGGEALMEEDIAVWHRYAPGTRLINEYGPTETVVGCCIYEVPADASPSGAIPIGRPIANTQLYILDANLHPVPINIPGELYIGGVGVARGYLNRPALTTERFIPHLWSTEPDARLYKTGDLARYRADGGVEFLGRIDNQVKIRGFRIELGEIEATLAQHPAVRECAVLVREDVPGDRRLGAYLVLREQTPPPGRELRAFLKETLPDYMLPAAYVHLEQLPLTPNGKLDRQALLTQDHVEAEREADLIAPRTPLEQALIDIWRDVLGIDQIGTHDNFFDLGGHSLLATGMLNRIEQVCGKKLPLAILFTEPTIERLANVLTEPENISSSVLQVNPRTPLIAVQTSGTRRPFFFLHGDPKGGAFYCLKMARLLGVDQPFYILEPYKFDGLHFPLTFEAMATAHLEVMQSVQPEGPYLLGGWCNGALLAYEMTRHLRAQGQAVDLLVLMDPGTTLSMRNAGAATLQILGRYFINCLGRLLDLDQKEQLAWFLRLQHLYRYLRYPHYRQAKAIQAPAASKQSESEGEHNKVCFVRLALFPGSEVPDPDWATIYDWLAWRYLPHHYHGKLTIFWDSADLYRRKAWQKIDETNEVETYIIPGDHVTSRTTYLPDLAEHLRICLNKVQQAGEHSE